MYFQKYISSFIGHGIEILYKNWTLSNETTNGWLPPVVGPKYFFLSNYFENNSYLCHFKKPMSLLHKKDWLW